jgi:fused signal recognition particle receptor
MKWGFKRSKEKEEQTPEAVTEEVTEEAESIEEEAKESSEAEPMEDTSEESSEAEPMEDTSEESSETEPTEDTSEQNSETESSENESEENSETEKKQGFFSRLVAGLTKTRDSFVSGIDSIFSGFSSIDDDFYEEIEEILIMGDIGVRATQEILENLQQKVKENHIKQPEECKELLIQSIKEQMEVGETAYRFEHEKSVVLVVGVNGVGKTTSVGKLAGKLKAQGRKVVLAAADTFRAAAGAQLEEWAHRAGVDMIGGQEGADPAAVVYDAVAAAKARKADVLLCDTAGRLHNKKNLMEELKKINRIIDKEYPDAFRETLVVLDGTTGQNALAQAKQFMEVADITGIILTKMDGTAKGGIAVAIQSELGIPVKYIGVGETIDDLQKFDSEQFVDALFSTREE